MRTLALPLLSTILVTTPYGCGARDTAPPASSTIRVVDLEGRMVDPFELADASATVFVFTRTDCPISNRYAPEIRRLHERFEPRNVVFYLVYPDPRESADVIRKHLKEYGYKCRALRDPQHALVKLTGATITPEAAIFAGPAELIYRGRIDDRYVALGQARATATTKDVEVALEAALNGRPVPNPTTQAVGCIIADLR